MAKKNKRSDDERSPLLETARKILLASIGAVALAQDEIDDFINKLVGRGEIAEKDGKKLIKEILEKRKTEATKIEVEVVKRVEEVFSRLNMPTKNDITTLNQKISALEEKIEAITKLQE